MPERELDRGWVRLVAQAVGSERQLGGVELVCDTVVDVSRPGGHRHAVQQLERFLNLERRHHGSDGRGGRHLSRKNLVAREKRAAISSIEELIIALGHCALVACRIRRHENLDDALNFLDARVDPRRARFPALAVDPEPGLAIVEASDDEIDVGEEPEPDIGHDVTVEWE